MLAALGATPVQMPLPAVPESMSKGVIDGAMVPWEGVPAAKLHEIAKSHLDVPAGQYKFANSIFAFVMNQAKYDGLPADLKKVIDANSGPEYSQAIGKIWDNSQAVGRKAAQDHGNTFHMIPASELDNWVKASAPLYDSYVADMDAKGLPGKQMLQDARDLLVKYRK
jgi:TRAP-type C4-dicarboxylate transport system substrate-binding protein